MRVVRRRPPFYWLICRFIGTPPATAVYTYGNTIYSPATLALDWDLRVHEAAHRRQQGRTPWLWWARYLVDKRFRIHEESTAYRAQLETFDRSRRDYKALEFAKVLASGLYGEAVTTRKALAAISKEAV